LVRGADGQRLVAAVVGDGLQQLEELLLGLGLAETQLVEGCLVVDEAVDDRRHRNAERGGPVIGDPRALSDRTESADAGQVRQRCQVAAVEQRERRIEGAAGDEVAGGPADEAGVQRGVVVGGRRRVELDVDVGELGLEHRDDLVIPDRGVVRPPTLDRDRHDLVATVIGRLGSRTAVIRRLCSRTVVIGGFRSRTIVIGRLCSRTAVIGGRLRALIVVAARGGDESEGQQCCK